MLLAVVTVRVDVVVAGLGLNVPVAPVGKPLAERFTAPVNPSIDETVTP